MKILFISLVCFVALLSISGSRAIGSVLDYDELSISTQGQVFAPDQTLITSSGFTTFPFQEAFYYWTGTGSVRFIIETTPGTPTANSPAIQNPLVLDSVLDMQRIRFRTLDGGIGTISIHYSVFNKGGR